MNTTAQRQMKLGMFNWPCGHHLAAWRHPSAVADGPQSLSHNIEIAQLAERGLFDMFFMADTLTFWQGGLDAMVRDRYNTRIDPFVLMCALSQHTTHLGFGVTASTTYHQPYALARQFASLDLISSGRAAWNLVTSANASEADSFGFGEHPAKSVRYDRAREFAHVVRGLWNSFDAGAFPRDKASGRYIDSDKINILEHKGAHFRVKGPLNVPPSLQGEPVMVQAGASEDGRELAAETAEVIFAVHRTLASARTFYTDMKARAVAHGRSADDIKIMPGLYVTIGRTEAEAQSRFDELQALTHPVVGLNLLSKRLDFDLTGQDVDGPLPEIPPNKVSASRADMLIEIARRERLTIRQLYETFAPSRGHFQLTGTPQSIADTMQEWFTTGACDGFNVMPAVLPDTLRDFVDLVVPELQRRDLFRTAYEGRTLRENLGLTRPAWPTRQWREARSR
jgi:FMN-dependent oxidoreductase (nitrilotriacetate monooxygenase family)